MQGFFTTEFIRITCATFKQFLMTYVERVLFVFHLSLLQAKGKRVCVQRNINCTLPKKKVEMLNTVNVVQGHLKTTGNVLKR